MRLYSERRCMASVGSGFSTWHQETSRAIRKYLGEMEGWLDVSSLLNILRELKVN